MPKDGVRRWGTGALPALALLSALAVPSGAEVRGPGADLEAALVAGPTVGDLVRYVYAASPAVGAARAGRDEARAVTRVADAWPDPALVGAWWPEKAGSDLPARWEVMLSQAVPLPGRVGALVQARRADEDAATIELDRSVRDAVRAVRESAHELDYLRRARTLAVANRELLERLQAQGAAAYAGGRTGLYDFLRAQAQDAQAGFDETLLADLERAELARLNSLLGRPPGAPIGGLSLEGPRPLAYDLPGVLALAGEGLEEIRVARTRVRLARANRVSARYESLPELMVGAGYEREEPLGEGDGMERYKFQLGVTLPIQPGKTAGRLAAARAAQERAEAALRAAADTAHADVHEAWFRVATAARLTAFYRDTLLPEAAAAVSRAEAWFRQGEGSFADLVEVQGLLYNFQLALARAEADHGRALARLEALAGRTLTRRDTGTAAPEAPR